MPRYAFSWNPAPRVDPALSDADFAYFGAEIERRSGIQLPPKRRQMVISRILPRIVELGLPSLHAYRERLETSPPDAPEWQVFVNLITTNKTEFFREAEHFEWILGKLLPEWWARHAGEPLTFNAWSAACSTGQEPYTLAMVLEEFRSRNPGFEYRILATDIDTQVLQRAKNGVYPAEALTEIPEKLRKRYTQIGRAELRKWFRASGSIHSRVQFLPLNLTDARFPATLGAFDLILCRNVFIYFSAVTIAGICARFAWVANPGAVLITGHSESLTSAAEVAEIGWAPLAPSILRRK